MKRVVLIFVAVAMLSGFNSYAQKGSVTPKILQQIQESFKNDEATKAATNAVSNNDIKKLALNRDNYGKVDHHFKYKVNVKGITDQKSSGRCWMFTGLNVMRPKAMDHLNISDFEFSTNYLYFWDQFEKANLFLKL
jgi:bleomycin hydrolase